MYGWWERFAPLLFSPPCPRFRDLQASYDPDAMVPPVQRRYQLGDAHVHGVRRRHWHCMERAARARVRSGSSGGTGGGDKGGEEEGTEGGEGNEGQRGKKVGTAKNYKFDERAWTEATRGFFQEEFGRRIFESGAKVSEEKRKFWNNPPYNATSNNTPKPTLP